jgi:hypothetical protein
MLEIVANRITNNTLLIPVFGFEENDLFLMRIRSPGA